MDYIIETMKKLLAIPSPSGFTREAAEFVMGELKAMGYEPQMTLKRGVVCDLGGEKKDDGILLAAHIDTLGAMVQEIKSNGRLRLINVGGLKAANVECENCMVHTHEGKTIGGVVHLINASTHVNDKYNETHRTFDTVEMLLDEYVNSKEEVEALGIMVGDYVSFDPRTIVTESGFIKSRFLDDKLCAAVLLGYAKYLKEEGITPKRRVHIGFTSYEEVGHGGAADIPEGVTEMISVDMGCVG
jgi:putative aminopeptidase FrvX